MRRVDSVRGGSMSVRECGLGRGLFADHSYKAGDIFYGLPYHVCPTVALYERVFTVENNLLTGYWKNTARDRIIGL